MQPYQCSHFGDFAGALELNQSALVSPSPSPSAAPINAADTGGDWLPIDQAVLLTIFVIVMAILLFLAVVWVYWRHKHEISSDDESDALYYRWEAEAEDEGQAEPEQPVVLEEEDEVWATEAYGYYPEDHPAGADGTDDHQQLPPEEDDEEDSLELVEWTGNRGETRLTRIAQGAGERGASGPSHRLDWAPLLNAPLRR